MPRQQSSTSVRKADTKDRPDARPTHEVLVVEDDPQLRFLLADNLEFEGYRVKTVKTAEEALEEIATQVPSLMILDVMLPRKSGLELCRDVRARGLAVPIIMLTARSGEADRVLGLDLGADDYVAKPFSVRELMARIRAQLRRTGRDGEAAGRWTFGDVTVNLRARLVLRCGQRVVLSPREFELLRYLLAHRGEVVSREQLLRDVWGYNNLAVTRTVDNYVSKLRTQLEPKPHEPCYLITVHGSGYQLLA